MPEAAAVVRTQVEPPDSDHPPTHVAVTVAPIVLVQDVPLGLKGVGHVAVSHEAL